MEKIISMLKNIPLFAGVAEKDLLQIIKQANGRMMTCEKDQYILHAGDHTSALGLILEGNVLIVQEDFWGGRHILAKAGQGSCFAETFACTKYAQMNVSVIAQQHSRVLFLNVQNILGKEIPGADRLIRNLLEDMALKNIAFSEKLNYLGQRTTRKKLLSYLSQQAQKQGSEDFEIPFSRQQLADYLLVERSGLSAELCKMRDEGLLEFCKNHFVLK